MLERAGVQAGAGIDRRGGSQAHWNHRGIYAEYAAVRLFEYQRVGTIGPGKSLAAPAEPFERFPPLPRHDPIMVAISTGGSESKKASAASVVVPLSS